MKQLLSLGFLGMAAVTFAVDPGQYTNSLGDKLSILENGECLLTQTRQVGGAGGLSTVSIVPFPTICKFVEFGKIKSETFGSITYQVSGVELVNPVGSEHFENCVGWALVANTYARTGTLTYSLRKNDFK